jgi:hypothetical protein
VLTCEGETCANIFISIRAEEQGTGITRSKYSYGKNVKKCFESQVYEIFGHRTH